MYLIRVCVKFFVERLKEPDVLRQFSTKPENQNSAETVSVAGSEASLTSSSTTEVAASNSATVEPGQRYEALINGLIDIIVELPCK